MVSHLNKILGKMLHTRRLDVGVPDAHVRKTIVPPSRGDAIISVKTPIPQCIIGFQCLYKHENELVI